MDRAKKKKIAASIAAIMHYESEFTAAPAEAAPQHGDNRYDLTTDLRVNRNFVVQLER